MDGYLGGSDKQPYEGEFHLSGDVYKSMEQRAAERPKTEVGGMLFGAFEKEDGKVVDVRVERVVNVPDDQGVHQATYFSIDDAFMDEVVDEYIPPYTYLGNWHSHLGYGGPSSGDHKQVTKFFENNSNRDYLIAVIQDRAGGIREPDYNTYIELYERKQDGSPDYRIHKITDVETIEHPPERTVDDDDQKKGTNEDLVARIEDDVATLELSDPLASDILNVATELATEITHVQEEGMGTVYQRSGEAPETILIVPIELPVESGDAESESTFEQAMDEVSKTLPLNRAPTDETSEQTDALSAFLSISIPGGYPEGEIYIDIKSRDQTVQATVMQLSCAELSASPTEFRNQIQTMFETDIDEFVAQSVGQLLSTRGGGS